MHQNLIHHYETATKNFSNLSVNLTPVEIPYVSLVRHCGIESPEEITRTTNLSPFKYNLKKHYLKEPGKTNFNFNLHKLKLGKIIVISIISLIVLLHCY